MAFKLVIEDSIDVPVNVDINSGAKRRNFFFHLKARRMDVQTWQGYFGESAERPNMKIREFLQDNITGWRGQQLVVDDSDKPADFSAESFDCMLSVVGVEMLIFVAYQKAIFASDGDAGCYSPRGL